MPVIRKKLKKFTRADYESGPCVTIGKEIWFIRGKKLSVGEVTKVVEDVGVHVKTTTGTVFLTPGETIIMTAALPEIGE